MDRVDLESLLDAHGPRLLGLAESRLRRAGFGRAEAEEVLQEVWLALLKRPGLLPADPGPYLAAMVLNAARQWLREGTRRAGREAAHPLRPLPGTPDEPLLRREDAAGLREALGRLHPDDQLLLRWIYWEGLDYASAGSLLGLLPDSVGPRLSRAREALKIEVSRHG